MSKLGMTKLLCNADLPESARYSQIVEDMKDFSKTAEARHSSLDFNDPEVIPDKDHVAIHLVALGDEEHYGFNRNGDSFPKEACVNHHDTFVKHGKVYEHHRASDPKLNMGKVVKSAYVDPMGRIELIVHAHKDKASDHLHKMASKGEASFSMGCNVAYDVCSKCDTKRANSRDPKQCDHVKYDLGKMAEDGSFIGTRNPEPKFFDISFVTKPADRIAWSLSKSASAGDEFMDGIKAAEYAGLRAPADVVFASDQNALIKSAIAKKLLAASNDLRKIAECGPTTNEEAFKWALRHASATAVFDDAKIAALREYNHNDTFSALAQKGIVLDPVSYVKLAMGIDLGVAADHMEAYKQACSNLFTDEQSTFELCADGFHDVTPGVGHSQELDKLASAGINLITGSTHNDLAIKHSIECGDVQLVPDVKTAANNSVADTLAASYGAYKLSALAAITSKQADVLDIVSNTSILTGQHMFNISYN